MTYKQPCWPRAGTTTLNRNSIPGRALCSSKNNVKQMETSTSILITGYRLATCHV